MPTRAEVELLRISQAELTARVRSELASLASRMTGSPAAIRDALLEIVPILVTEFGEVAATVSAEWFEEVYGARAVMARPIRAEFVERGVRYTAGHLFDGDPTATLAALDVKLDQWIKQAGRDTIARSADRHGLAYARVPSGDKTCAFCLIMASRGAVYDREWNAGGNGNAFHGACDCHIVAVRSQDDLPEGYDPEELYDVYSASRDAAGSADIKDIAAAMRREFPDRVNDPVHTH